MAQSPSWCLLLSVRILNHLVLKLWYTSSSAVLLLPWLTLIYESWKSIYVAWYHTTIGKIIFLLIFEYTSVIGNIVLYFLQNITCLAILHFFVCVIVRLPNIWFWSGNNPYPLLQDSYLYKLPELWCFHYSVIHVVLFFPFLGGYILG